MSDPRVSICLCTFRRPELLERTLRSILGQQVDFSIELVVVDNDSARTGESSVDAVRPEAEALGVPLTYDMEPEQNIARARNRAVSHARGEYVVFIDDDERADDAWLANLIGGLERFGFDGVFAPVLSEYPEGFPEWITRLELVPRPRFPSGTPRAGIEGRTGNTAIKKAVLLGREGPFDPVYGLTGGSDTDLLDYLDREHGARFGWIDDAVVYELQDWNRARPRWYLRRAYRSGWVRTRRAIEVRGGLAGTAEVLVKILPSFLSQIANALREFRNPRAMLLLIGMGAAGQAGKFGYLLGIRLEEYRAKPAAGA